MQPIGSPYVKLPGDGNRLKPRTYGETTKDAARTEWLGVRPTVKSIVQDYNETSF
ncbi:MAG TPA: hypothetical protein VEP90_06035 [Methylomirabilota bacterium]|nr:hypothetical protein [Methylomirabilota bacterium]